MKNKIQNIVILMFLMANNMLFAQGPDPDGAGGGVNPTDAPLDANLIFLAIAGIVLCYAFLNRKLKTI